VPADRVKIIAEYKTPISDVLTRCNKDSFQLAAECLLKTASAQSQPWKRYGSWENGKKLIAKYLASLGVKDSEFALDDGCGLSHVNKLSAHSLTAVLLNVYKSPNWKMFSESLSVGGQDGTMHRYFKENKYRGRILAKTGYINGVKSLSGVCSTDNGDYIFSILTNNAVGDSRDCINDIVETLIDSNCKSDVDKPSHQHRLVKK
jgi:D-alanyl-D-alanine carboxypeptidase/D-alanyl-D-alanine-endopeptidase (penicillin-binding protein 4)